MKKRKSGLKKWVKKTLAVMLGIGCITVVGAQTVVVKVNASVKNLVISDETLEIEKYAYYENSILESVVIPQNVKNIGFSAFEKCTALKTVEFAPGLETVDNRAFAECESLQEILLPDTVTTMGNAAFYRCKALKKVTLPSDILRLENNLFYQCYSLEDIVLPDSVTEIGQQSFFACKSLKEIILPENLQKIEDGAFYQCTGLTKLYLPASITYIGKDAFEGCEKLELSYEPGSYAEKYVQEMKKGQEVVIPATGVKTPYFLCIFLMGMAGAVLVVLKRTEEQHTSCFK